MPIWDRDWYRNWFFKGKHPPTCSCVDCTNKRLGKLDTKHSVTKKDITPIKTSKPDFVKSAKPIPIVQKDTYHYKGTRISNWVLSLLFIFAVSVIGLGISLYIGSFVPFWLMFGFSLIFSIEKWFHYFIRKYKSIGKLYRLILNCSTLSLLGLIIWWGIKLFSKQLTQSPLIGSLILLVEFILFVWIWRVVAKNSWRWPSMKLTVFSLICIFIIFAFAGVQPMTSYKDATIGKINNFVKEQQIKAEERRIAEENRRAAEKAEMDSVGVVSEYDFYKDYVVFFNKFRSENGRPPLVFDRALNKLAAERAIEISQPGNFSHEGIKRYNFGENIAMMAYSSDSASDLIEQWASSSGHRSNMLLYSYHRTGFAKNGKYAVQIFD